MNGHQWVFMGFSGISWCSHGGQRDLKKIFEEFEVFEAESSWTLKTWVNSALKGRTKALDFLSSLLTSSLNVLVSKLAVLLLTQ